ncbi:unnamed protein product, partial [Rotaria magnacalcarata]
ACHLDPLLDDSLAFARRLRLLSVEHHITVVENLPCARDPFIDDNVEFARRLRALNVPHRLVVVDEWPHGYLDYGFAANDLALYNTGMMTMLQNIVQQSSR